MNVLTRASIRKELHAKVQRGCCGKVYDLGRVDGLFAWRVWVYRRVLFPLHNRRCPNV